MKKESPLWSSISLLIGIVIAILALVRGRILLPLLLAVFALWLLWWLLTQALPLWRNNRAYRAKEARLREQTAAANGMNSNLYRLIWYVLIMPNNWAVVKRRTEKKRIFSGWIRYFHRSAYIIPSCDLV